MSISRDRSWSLDMINASKLTQISENPSEQTLKDKCRRSSKHTKETNGKESPSLGELLSENKKITKTDNPEVIFKMEINKYSLFDRLKRCMSENFSTKIPYRTGSATFTVPLPNKNEKSIQSIIPTDSTTDNILLANSSYILSTESLKFDTYFESANLPSRPVDNKTEKDSLNTSETAFSLTFQVFIPFIIAGYGTCAAGILLDLLQYWNVFREVSELFIVVPTLLGLKGNLEMTLASRLSTQANLGNVNSVKTALIMGWGNMTLKLAQASSLAFLAAIFAIIMTTVRSGGFNYQHALLISCSSISTGAITTVGLGTITTTVVFLSYYYNINPDNIATPVAASLGDITTLSVLAIISKELYRTSGYAIVSAVAMGIFLSLIPLWIFFARNNIYTRQLILTGWVPVLVAAVITSFGGYILQAAVKNYEGVAIFQPVINGVGGNLVAVQASRISTYFHQRCILGNLPSSSNKICISPCAAFFGKHDHSRTARILILMVIPGHLLFSYSLHLIKHGQTSLNFVFLPIYLIITLLQVTLLLYIAHILIHIMWKWKIDPDNSAIPILTALGDLSGTAFLTFVFYLYNLIS